MSIVEMASITTIYANMVRAAFTLEETIHTLQAQYDELASQFSTSHTSLSPTLTTPNDPALANDFARATERPRQTAINAKAVRFSDPHDAEHEANRSALFPYSDNPALSEPSTADTQAELSNEQIHAYHSSVLREQDDALDRLGQSIGRQRELSMQIGNELDEQVLMLDEVDGLVDRQQGRLDGARRGLRGVADRASDNCGGVTIAVLVVVLLLVVLITK